MEDFKAAYS
jgi:hypothetical protein